MRNMVDKKTINRLWIPTKIFMFYSSRIGQSRVLKLECNVLE